jgi:hypothetical protein
MPTAHGYPYYEATLWGGRLPVPPQYRGTVLARQFETGQIGGRAIQGVARFVDTDRGRADLVAWARRHQGERVEIAYLRDPHRCRVPIGTHVVLDPAFVKSGVPPSALR